MSNPTGQWKESLSLEETNKVRISLGLKPLSDPNNKLEGPTDEERLLEGDELAELNFRKKREGERRKVEEKELQERLDRARNQKERGKKLKGRGLGAEEEEGNRVKLEEGATLGGGEDEGGDTKSWVKKQKKRAKELALKRQKEQEEQDRLAEEEELARGDKYGERDLKGIKVAHDAEAFDEGEEHVLTLKDSRILDDEDDELHNLNMTENARHKAAVDLKKKGRQAGQYTGFDDDEFDGAGDGTSKKGVLSKYDEGFEGAVKGDGFQLGDEIVFKSKKNNDKGEGSGEKGENGEREKVKLSMEYTKSFNSDYLQEGDAGFKKPKMKKKKRPARTTTISNTLEDDSIHVNNTNADSMQIDSENKPETSKKKQIERIDLDSSNLIDDDDLSVSLARQRREAAKLKIKQQKERARLNLLNGTAGGGGDDDVERVKMEEGEDGDQMSTTKTMKDDGNDDGEDVLVLDDTSEFVRNIRSAAEEASSSSSSSKPVRRTAPPVKKEEDEVLDRRGLESIQPRIKIEDEEEEGRVPLTEMEVPSRSGGWNAARDEDQEEDEQDVLMRNLDERSRSATMEDGQSEEKPRVGGGDDDDEEFGGTGAEKLVSKGLASTLSILRHQGLMKARTPEEIAKEKEFKEREAWLVAQRRRDAEREQERIASRNAGDRKDQRQREYENKLRDQRDAQAAMAAYRDYRPVVELKYHDEFGRDMTPKEAWKHLSHSFHGHGHGSKKTEKRLQKIENERKAAAMAAGDTPNSTAAAFAARAEMTGSATMILGVGNNNSAPMQPSDDTLSLSKSKSSIAKGKGKASNASQTPVFNDIPMRNLPLPSSSSSAQHQRDVSSTPEPSASGSQSTRKGFAPVRSFSPANGSNGGEDGVGSGPKFAPISVAVKRKASEQGEGSPASKRRA